ncbi:hypothetical protein PZA11_006207 [Diplocarpon coronariae]|uniref:Uncharacterized protein n=1 Tax=Diplocarpon coronariae TaxID=2795749 RepID=A0A218ZH86_9HELO|nr:hypothetical protein JHW43_007248 [Diplocarpon mali]OWP07112.1 hypothetical protein B2J93_6692 [Marssonina coronariae]
MYQFHQEQHCYALQLVRDNVLKQTRRSWVMTTPNEAGFVKLPNERILYTSPPRTSLQLSTPNNFPGAQPFSAKSDAGIVYLTNQRIVYLPSSPTPELQSFSSPILNLQDTYVRAPFFGANYWVALCKPVAGGNIPSVHGAVELRLTFRDGGAFDFHTTFEQLKERVYQAYTVAQESSHRDAAGNIDLANVHLEQLPAYEAAREVVEDDGPTILSPVPLRPGRDSGGGGVRSPVTSSPKPDLLTAPDDPPPGYEEAQAQAVGINPDERLRQGVGGAGGTQ